MIRFGFIALVALLPDLSRASHAFSIGITGGMVSPYGLGVEFQRRLQIGPTISLGSGMFLDGIKFGGGAVQYFRMGKKLNPMGELYGSYSTGLEDITLKTSSSSTENEYSFPSSWSVHAGGGVRWNILSWLSLKWSLGYRLVWLSDDIAVNGVKTEEIADDTIDRLMSSGAYIMATCQFQL